MYLMIRLIRQQKKERLCFGFMLETKINLLKNKEVEFYKWLARKITNNKSEILKVAFWIDIIVFQILETLLVLSMSIYFGLFWYTISVMIGFSFGRLGNIGYHSKTKIGCMMYSTISFIGLSYIGSSYGVAQSFLCGMLFGLLLRKRNK